MRALFAVLRAAELVAPAAPFAAATRRSTSR
jgi:hypothetical protein